MKRIDIIKPDWLPGFRSLVRCYQAHERVAEEHFRKLGVTGAQFDVLVTLGNTEGLTCRELGERTLITKGTLTGVIDRLIEKGWVVREACSQDRRVIYIRLTESGVETFERIFQPHLDYMSQVFQGIDMGTWHQIHRACDAVSAQLLKGAEHGKTAQQNVSGTALDDGSRHYGCGCDGDGI